ncbi:hypothetical protein [Acetobacter peroxydans]|uniref:TIR domain-containing protein n=1 Tax=Acetobacter peroxydans TaxID=104098 RepID=A0A4Y3TZT0_9PROT|nr:hypothetical protein [Acetobacter peroxydans]NHO17175.1 hypothetical protein [Acetobacter peroxydans]GBR35589.1 hypothetical protein AA13755_1272 [Acetobacter peroxydans NBRC 13755]GBR39408.1 hypothetical protein AA0475_0174 [Acetobacter peroxydans]GEB86205.1 hypothetical protein APE01nite_20020 [Acetobacter peroxydans]
MALLTETEVLARAGRTMKLRESTALESLTETASADATFDVFLSHSSREPENILLEIKGYLEDAGGRIGIAPVAQAARSTFDGEQYVGLYPYLDRAMIEGQNKWTLWINCGVREYTDFRSWVRGDAEITKRAR